MASNMNKVIMLAVALMVVAVIYPIALGLISAAGDTIVNSATNATLADVADPAVITLLTVLLPIIAIIAVVLFFLPGNKAAI